MAASRRAEPTSARRACRDGILGRLVVFIAIQLVTLSCARAEERVDLLLVLAVDASGSVNTQRFELQRQGYAQAFRNPQVLKAIRNGPAQSIAVTMTQWTGPHMQQQVVEWTRVHDAATADGLARSIETTHRRLFGGGTSISGAIDHAMTLFPLSPYRAERRVIDVSGDGANNRGRPADNARDDAITAGATVNGLPILALEPLLDEYYLRSVIGGPGAFMVPAADYESFADAILKKLILEISQRSSPGRRLARLGRP